MVAARISSIEAEEDNLYVQTTLDCSFMNPMKGVALKQRGWMHRYLTLGLLKDNESEWE